jgi:LacI family transcriptional regulator
MGIRVEGARMAVRLKDIARDVGVSTVTVSKVLRGSKDVGEKTRQTILKRMKELNYQPNLMARALHSGKTHSVGMVVPDLVHPFFAEFAKSLSGSLRETGRALILASSEEDAELEQKEIRALLGRGIDVLLIASCQLKLKNFYNLGDEQTPYILVDRNFPYLNANFVGCDDFRIGEMATRHLVEIGRRRIAHIGMQGNTTGIERLHGYRTMLSESGLRAPEDYVVTRERFEHASDEVGYQAMQRLLQLQQRPDAVFCYNDLTAIGAMQAALDAGLEVPNEMAFIGCGNFRYADYLRVPLSSIDQSTRELGEAAGRLALELVERPDQAPKAVVVEAKLIVRGSSVAANSAPARSQP